MAPQSFSTVSSEGNCRDSRSTTGHRALDISRGWEFVRKRASHRWICFDEHMKDVAEAVDLPHSWNSHDTFQCGVKYYRGPGTYRRKFIVPKGAADDSVWLRSEGFYGTGDVWINGRHVAYVDGQFLGFALPVGHLLLPGDENQVAIRITNRCSRWVLPGIKEPDFVLHGGLAGRVWVETAGSVCFEDDHLHVDTGGVGTEDARVEAQVPAFNHRDSEARVETVWTLLASDGTCVARHVSPITAVPPNGRSDITVSLDARAALLWSSDEPRLYVLNAALMVNGAVVDRISRRIGFRTAEFRPDEGFFLNGTRLFLRGCNRHESMPGLGNALPDALNREDAQNIRDLGLNFVRLSHYPQSPVFLDACDELGILVYAELASWKSVRTGLWIRRALRQFDGLIRRDRHHPSVILWGMGNESRSLPAFKKLRAVARRLDPCRPVTYAENHFYRAVRKHTLGISDVWGCNYEFDRLEQGRDAALLRNVIISECANEPHAVRGDFAAERMQLAQLEQDSQRAEASAFVAGFTIWCYNDYATMRKRRYVRHCGIVDAWREPKMAASWLRSRYAVKPFVKIETDWSEDSETYGETRRVDVFSSVGTTQVSLNGKQVTTLQGRGHHRLDIHFEPGCLEVFSEADASIHDSVDSYGSATRLVLEQASTTPFSLHLRVVDAQGHWVRHWQGEVTISASGAASFVSYRPGAIKVTGGLSRIFISPPAEGLSGELHVSAPSLIDDIFLFPNALDSTIRD